MKPPSKLIAGCLLKNTILLQFYLKCLHWCQSRKMKKQTLIKFLSNFLILVSVFLNFLGIFFREIRWEIEGTICEVYSIFILFCFNWPKVPFIFFDFWVVLTKIIFYLRFNCNFALILKICKFMNFKLFQPYKHDPKICNFYV